MKFFKMFPFLILLVFVSCSEEGKKVDLGSNKVTPKKKGDLVVLEGQERNGSFPDAAKTFVKKVQDDLITKLNILNQLEVLDSKSLQNILKEYSVGEYHINPIFVTTSYIVQKIKDLRFDNRHGQEDLNRIFNYGKDSEGTFIRVTENFLKQYNSYSEYFAPKAVVKEIQRMMIHEVSHLWGFQEAESHLFSKQVVKLFEKYINVDKLIINAELLNKVRGYDNSKMRLKNLILHPDQLALKDYTLY